mgnify:CR=1 FL=1
MVFVDTVVYYAPFFAFLISERVEVCCVRNAQTTLVGNVLAKGKTAVCMGAGSNLNAVELSHERHEMTHGFDDQGRQFDKDGNFSNWWTDADAKAFNALVVGL